MNYRMIGYLLGLIVLIEAALLIIPTIIALIYGESVIPFAVTIAIMLVVGVPFVVKKPSNTRIYAKDGYICVAAAWLILSAFGALPFVISGAIPSYVDAFFETVSGFTTTGATLMPVIEGIPYGVLFWRSFTHWIGGMGVLVFMLAIVPSRDGNAIHLLRAETPGPTKGKIVPKLRQTAMILYLIYIALTVAEIIALLITGLPLYDSVVTAVATAGTGGFAVKNASIASYVNPAAEWVVAVFMLLFGVNFNVYFLALVGKIRNALKSEELRTFLIIVAASMVLFTVNTWGLFDKVGDCIRAAFFQTTSIMSTTGFSTVDFNQWPMLSRSVIVLLMFIGACAGSTAGGLKISRILIISKNVVKEVKHLLRPNSVNVLKVDGEVVREETAKSAVNYFAMYFAIMVAAALLISVDGFSFETNVTASITCLNNIGPGLGSVGPMDNFSIFSPFSKIILSFTMLFGRLEIIPMVVFFAPSAWRNK